MTKREMFNAIREVVIDNEEMVAFLDKEIALLDRKASAPKKPTAKQVENERIKEVLFNHLVEVDRPESIAMLKAEVEEVAEMNPQKIAPLLNALVKAEKLDKVYINHVPHFGVK